MEINLNWDQFTYISNNDAIFVFVIVVEDQCLKYNTTVVNQLSHPHSNRFPIDHLSQLNVKRSAGWLFFFHPIPPVVGLKQKRCINPEVGGMCGVNILCCGYWWLSLLLRIFFSLCCRVENVCEQMHCNP